MLRTSHLKLSLVVFALALLASGCTKVPPELTPQGVILYRANEVVVGLGTAQHAAIELNKVQRCTAPVPPETPVCTALLSTENTGHVVDAVTDALTTIKSVPDGWRATADAAIVRIESRVDAAGKVQILPYLEALRIIIKGGGQ